MSSLSSPSAKFLVFRSPSRITYEIETEKDSLNKCQKYSDILNKMEKITYIITMVGAVISGVFTIPFPIFGLSLAAATILLSIILVWKRESVSQQAYNAYKIKNNSESETIIPYTTWKQKIYKQIMAHHNNFFSWTY